MERSRTRTVSARIALDGARTVALRLDERLVVREVAGGWTPVPVGVDAREAVPALIGMESVLAEPEPALSLPFVSLAGENGEEGAPVALSAVRDPGDGALWILIRDAGEEAEIRQTLVQQHNALALAQRELAAARDAALAADRAKTRFLANASHELRTPLNIVIGGAEIIMKERATPLSFEEIRGYCHDIRQGGLMLLRLVEDLIDLSRAETGDLTLYEEWCDPGAALQDAVRLIRATPDAAALTVEAEGAAPPFYADPVRLKQILLNLLSNAVKVSAPGGRIEARVWRDADTGELALRVRDEGPGMSAEQLAIALEPFGQPEPGVRAKGSGLGLAIVSRLAKLHDGALSIETAPGAGLSAEVRLGATRFGRAEG